MNSKDTQEYFKDELNHFQESKLLKKILFVARKLICFRSRVYRKLELPTRGIIMEAEKIPKTLRNIYSRE